MSMPIQASTELDAVNLMLSVIGESPVNALDTSGYADQALAYQLLTETSRQIQSEGWGVNSEADYTFPADNSGFIAVPPNLLKAIVTPDYSLKYAPVVRGSKFYDKLNHTYVFPEAVHFDVVWFLPFDQITEQLRSYIALAAARKFEKRFFSSESVDKFTQDDEMKARALALEADAEVSQYNMTHSSAVFQVINRGGMYSSVDLFRP